MNGETDVRPNGLALGELHGPFTGVLVSAAVPMDGRRRFKRVGLHTQAVAALRRPEGCKLCTEETLTDSWVHKLIDATRPKLPLL